MAPPPQDAAAGDSGGTKIAAVDFSPVIFPGTFTFGLYDDQGLKIEGGFEIENFVLSKHMPLVSQDFADKAVVIEEFKLAFEHAVAGSQGSGANDQFILQLSLVLDGNPISTLKLPLAGATTSNASPAAALATPGGTGLVANPSNDAQPTVAPPGSIFWINIQKSIGPIHIERIGFNCIGDDVQVLLDAGLATTSFSVELTGLSATIPIFNLSNIDDIKMGLTGLDVAFSTSALTIEGGLLITEYQGEPEYDGALLIKTADFLVAALGSFTSIRTGSGTQNSLFGFAFLDHEIGGPPCFFVTGLSAGFGYNRSVKIPTIAEVGTFPLLAGLNDPSQVGLAGGGLPKASDLANVLAKMDSYITPDLGEYWFAAGVQFTSFELIHSNVVAVVEVGKEFDLFVLGKSYGSFPPAGTTYAYVELDIEVVLQPDQGLFKAEAILAPNSYVLDPNCHLTGGFAFYSWFGSNPHAGDFVFTVGGYHPAFKPPSHYPVVDRLGFNWPVSSEVLIKGGAYFALTPSCIMAGGSLEASYQSGNLRAWFTAYADILIYWKPFYFLADIGVDIGVSYHVHFLFVSTTLSFELGATVNLWGPPTGGEVHVHLWIISFTVSFGASEGAGDQTLEWPEFQQMLAKPRQQGAAAATALAAAAPVNSELCHITISDGLIDQVTDNDGSVRWLVRADEFTFDAASTVPMTTVSLNGASLASTAGTLAIRPMKVAAIKSSVGTITVTSEDDNPMTWNTPQPLARSLPQALWGAPAGRPDDLDPNQNLIANCLIGVAKATAAPAAEPQHTGQIDVAQAFTYFLLYPDGATTLPHLPISAQAAVVPTVANPVTDSRKAVINPAIATTASQRGQIVTALNAMIAFPQMDETMAQFDAVANFETDPLVGKLAA
jgi:hypothetical protein